MQMKNVCFRIIQVAAVLSCAACFSAQTERLPKGRCTVNEECAAGQRCEQGGFCENIYHPRRTVKNY